MEILLPAREAECRQCKKKGHFALMCRTGKRDETIMEGDLLEEEVVFMGEINTDKEAEYWSQELELNKQAMCFKLDMGAAVTAIPKYVYSK